VHLSTARHNHPSNVSAIIGNAQQIMKQLLSDLIVLSQQQASENASQGQLHDAAAKSDPTSNPAACSQVHSNQYLYIYSSCVKTLTDTQTITDDQHTI
jgi:hypothetical protein